jgi:glycosyltransferase involved in cell wall biosynthesis
MSRKRLLIFIVAYNAENHIEKVLSRIPKKVFEDYEYEILIIDDNSKDVTYQKAHDFKRKNSDMNIEILYNPINQRYGGNQKLGYLYAIENNFDYVVLLHGDGQYAPELVGEMVAPLRDDGVDFVNGSRMITKKNALAGGMPYYKFIGNIILTKLENFIMGSDLSEFHSGYRAYRIEALKKIPFEQNSNDFNFDTQIIIQFILSKFKIKEIEIPTYYGDEICHVNGISYARQIVWNCIQSRLHLLNIFYKKEYDITTSSPIYDLKLGYTSSHTMAIDNVEANTTVLDIGSGTGLIAAELAKKGCKVIGVDMEDQFKNPVFSKFHQVNIDEIDFEKIEKGYDNIIMLDIIEHLKSPEDFLYKLRKSSGMKSPIMIITTPNIAFILIRIQLMLGQFNYGKIGILDMTHTRLFTFGSLKTMLTQNGYIVTKVKGIPAPIPKALGDNFIAHSLLNINKLLIAISKSIFSYQIYIEIKPTPIVKNILEYTKEISLTKPTS